MANGNGFTVTEDTWKHMPEEQRSWITYETLQNMNNRINSIESRGLYHKACATIGGIIGGVAAALGMKWWS